MNIREILSELESVKVDKLNASRRESELIDSLEVRFSGHGTEYIRCNLLQRALSTSDTIVDLNAFEPSMLRGVAAAIAAVADIIEAERDVIPEET